ncbi:MAG: non-hydrolyzing UDP-N-acetylglucosamine 2-epimerase, partial [Candidatus Thorarchaeota archaeon]
SINMDKNFFLDLDLPPADYRVSWKKKGGYHGEQTAIMLAGIEKILLKEKPRCVLVCGDANTNLSGALAARKLNIKVGHVESGLRSNDWRMPEEHNRVMIDHISDYLFAPTEDCAKNLKKEHVHGRIVVTGNTIVDSVIAHRKIAKRSSNIISKMGIKKRGYILFTSHREENVDDPVALRMIYEILLTIAGSIKYKIIFPIHPRTKKNLTKLRLLVKLTKNPNIMVIDPVGYLDFLNLLENALVVITDSGGIQEESCIIKTPCVTIRKNTERPETIRVGANILAGLSKKDVLKAVKKSGKKKRNWSNPFGKGTSAKIIVNTILEDV